MDDDSHLPLLESWLRSYRPEELFDEDGAPVPALLALAPRGDRRMVRMSCTFSRLPLESVLSGRAGSIDRRVSISSARSRRKSV